MTNYLTGINKVSSNGVKEIFSVEKNPSEPNVIYEDQSAHNGDRLAIMQINYEDVSKGDENEIISNLETKFGANVIKQLIIQCAVDTSTQNKALSTIINTIYGDDKGIIVYDRRFNDQLGKT
jgi:hypothetical protein